MQEWLQGTSLYRLAKVPRHIKTWHGTATRRATELRDSTNTVGHALSMHIIIHTLSHSDYYVVGSVKRMPKIVAGPRQAAGANVPSPWTGHSQHT